MSIVRTTYHSRLATLSNQTRALGDRMGAAQFRAATGLDVAKVSDAPGRMSYIHSVKESRDDQQQYVENSDWAYQHMLVADQSLAGLADVLSDARELAVQMASETYNDSTRLLAQSEAAGLFDRALIFANANMGGRYIFAGQAYDAPAYDDTTGAYLGDTSEPSVDVADGNVSVLTGFDGSSLLQGTTDIIAALQNLATALSTGTATNVRPSIDELSDALDQIAEARTIVGGEMLRAEDGRDMATNLGLTLAEHESALVDADAVDAFTNLFELQQSFEAALQVTANARSSLLFSRI